MSRQATAQAAKKDQKAAIADKNAEKDRLAALGMTKTIKQAIGDDRCLCILCGATSNGPLTKCECSGGVRKPNAEDDGTVALIAAAKARIQQGSMANRAENMRDADAIHAARVKAKEAKGANPHGDLEMEFQGDGTEVRQIVEFPVGKLGMDIEKNAIKKVTEGGAAEELGVKQGWIISQINDMDVQASKQAIIKAASTAFKAGPVRFQFRVPIVAGFSHCSLCDKFLENEKFDETQLSDKGPGVQACSGCEDFADMGF